MYYIMKQMVVDTFKSFTDSNPALASDVINMDDKVDIYFKEINNEIAGLMKQNSEESGSIWIMS